MLRNNFYTVGKINKENGDKVTATIFINKRHEIFKGHFPENPVVPGVCMMQIIKDLLEDKLHKSVQLEKISNIKFINVVNPLVHDELEVNIVINKDIEPFFKVNGVVFFKDIVFLKIVNAIYF